MAYTHTSHTKADETKEKARGELLSKGVMFKWNNLLYTYIKLNIVEIDWVNTLRITLKMN